MSPGGKCPLKKPVLKRKRTSNYSFSKLKKKCVVNKSSTIPVEDESELVSYESDTRFASKSQECKSDSFAISTQQKLELKFWGLPEPILMQYEARGIVSMFPWQVECLSRGKVLSGGNLVYSAPTSAGKTLVAEILTIKTVLEKRKKVIIILPFVSVVREKMFYFQGLLGSSGVRVEGLMGGRSLPGGFKNVDVAICTIEKANSLVNRLLEEGSLSDVGCVVVDELHLLGDPFRGYLLELLLTKIKYMCATDAAVRVQLVGMSATLPNLSLLAQWLDAEVYQTDFRPVPLQEFLKVGSTVYDSSLCRLYEVRPTLSIPNDQDHVIWLCLETVLNGHSVLVFCPTKAWCEKLAHHIAKEFCTIGNSNHGLGLDLRAQLSYEAVVEVREQLKRCPSGLDKVLQQTVAFAVAFHHAGMTLEERDIIEGSFRSGTLRVLVATSTLSSGVNLPARRVIVRSPTFAGRVLESQTYRQMIGRAGRMGRDTAGESFLLSQKGEQRLAEQLVRSQLAPIQSCLGEGHLSGSLKRAILEVVASGVACTTVQLQLYATSTLLAMTRPDLASPIAACLSFLLEGELVREEERGRYLATPLGQACLAASLPPDQSLDLFAELGRARQCFVLDNDLHIVYQVTPYSVSSQWGNLDWLHMLSLWEELPTGMRRVGELVGVEERFMVRAMRGTIKAQAGKQNEKLSIHRRFYTALALQDLVNEVPLADVAAKFRCSRGMLQSLQQSAATFAGMVTAFCRRLGWASFELLVSQFQDRLQFGVRRELCDLMKLDAINSQRARALFDFGITTLSALAVADVTAVENALHKAVPFQTSKELDGETSFDTAQRNKLKHVWVTGRQGLTEREAAELLITEARDLLRKELGVADVKWEAKKDLSNFSDYGSEDSRNGKSIHKQLNVSDIVDTYLGLKPDSRAVKHDVKIENSDEAVVSEEGVSDCSKVSSLHSKNENVSTEEVPDVVSINTPSSVSPINFLWPGQEKAKVEDHSQHDIQNTCKQNVNHAEEQISKNSVSLPDAIRVGSAASPLPDFSPEKCGQNLSFFNETPFKKNSAAGVVVVSTPGIIMKDEVVDYFSTPFDIESSSVIVENQASGLVGVSGKPGRSTLFGSSTCISPIRADGNNSTKENSDMFSSPSAGTCSNLFSDSLLMDTQLKGVLDSCQTERPGCQEETSPETGYVSPVINKLKIGNKKTVRKNSANRRTMKHNTSNIADTTETPLTSKLRLFNNRERRASANSKASRIASVSTLKWSLDEDSLDQYKYIDDCELKTVANISSPWLRSERKTVCILEPEDLEEFQNSFKVCIDGSLRNRNKCSILDDATSELNANPHSSINNKKCTNSGCSHTGVSDSNTLLKQETHNNMDELITDSFFEQAFTTYWDAGNDEVECVLPSKDEVYSLSPQLLQNHSNGNWDAGNNGDVECVLPSEDEVYSLNPELLQKPVNGNPSHCKKLFPSAVKKKRIYELRNKRPLSLGMKKFKSHPSTQRYNITAKSSSNDLAHQLRASPEIEQHRSSEHSAVACESTSVISPVLFDESAESLKTPKKKSRDTTKPKCHSKNVKLCDGNCSSGDDIVLSSQNDSDSTVNSPWKSKLHNSPSFKNPQSSSTKPTLMSAAEKLVSGKCREPQSLPQKLEGQSWNSVNIIDVCGDVQLLDTFKKELIEQQCISLSVGCERVPEEPKIGARIMGQHSKSVPVNTLHSGERAIAGVAVCFGGQDAYYLSISTQQGGVPLDARMAVIGLLVQGATWLTSLRVFDCKEQAKVLASCGRLSLDTHCAEDPKVADWLLHPEDKEKNLQALCLTYAPDLARVADLAGLVRGVGSPALSIRSSVSARVRCCVEAVVTWHIVFSQRRLLQEKGLLALYTEVEMPTQLCLARSEVAGVGFSRAEAERLQQLLEKQMNNLEQQAYQLAGHPFSLTSPADIAKVLYRELRLSGGKLQGGKQRPSTNKEALLRLRSDHPLPGIILQWRKISSTVTKMVFPLLNGSVGERMFGCSVTHTATGRISMHEPNLQNIPRDFDISPPEGSQVPISMRLAFIAGEDRSFVSADYSQLELRLLAHFSADQLLCSILNSGRDVFTSIAATWNKIPETQVSTELRQRAKQVCYGMIYGMGTRALAEQMEVDEVVAANFVASFNRAYPGVKEFLHQAVAKCHCVGYVETLKGRRRYLPAISSSNSSLRSHTERQAVNSTIQGSAADVAKLAMVRVDSRLREAFPCTNSQPAAQLVLHLHDELLYEVRNAELQEVARIIKNSMEAAVSLSVQLPVKVRTGCSWGSLVDLPL